MTGFGRGTAASPLWQATVEAASVNRKQAEVVVLGPRDLPELETRIRREALQCISRGRVQISVRLDRPGGGLPPVEVDLPLARAIDASLARLGEAIGRPLQAAASDFLRQPGVIQIGTGAWDIEEVWQAAGPALAIALEKLTTMRAAEGEELRRDIAARLSQLRAWTAEIASAAPARLPRQREALLRRLREAGLEIDLADERVLRELALHADRCDISEELTRLAAHFDRFEEYLDAREPSGRALDFLCQEVFREFNTIGSKANDSGISHRIVEAKTELEKIREQVQNIE